MNSTPDHIISPILPWQQGWSLTEWDSSIPDRLLELEFDLIVSQPQSALQNLALDIVMQRQVANASRKAVMWVWDWSESAVVLGSYQSVRNEIDLDAARKRGFSFVRRMSGGGAMIVEPGRTCTFSLITPDSVVKDLSYVQSFAYLDRWLIRALRTLGIPATYKPVNDIASPEAKIGGAAQARRWGTMLHHVTMAYDFDPALLTGLLRLGKEKLIEKGIPSAEKQVSPLSDYTSLSHKSMLDYLADAFEAQYSCKRSAITPEDETAAQKLIGEKLGTREWLLRVE
jgi:lipoate---protein ligase